MAGDTTIPDKLGEWIPVDAETHVMPVDIDWSTEDEDSNEIDGARCIMQVESETGSVALAETYIPAPLLMKWIEEADTD